MNWGNPLLLAGAAAFLVPLLIHLLYRSRYNVRKWGAMFLLDDVMRRNQRKLKWHHRILLAIRIAVPILLAIALAGPVISKFVGPRGDAPVSLSILLDDSTSMTAVEEGRSHWVGAIEAVEHAVTQLPSGSDVRIETLSGRVPEAFARPRRDLGSLGADLDKLTPNGGYFDGWDRWQKALADMDTRREAAKVLLVVSDFRDVNWQAARSGSDSNIPAAFWQVGSEKSVDNLYLADVKVRPGLSDEPGVLDVTIGLENGLGREIVLTAHLKGNPIAAEAVSVVPGTTIAKLQLPDLEKGDHAIDLSFEAGDAFPHDNRMSVLLHQQDHLVVHLLGDTEEADLIDAVLAPFAKIGEGEHDGLRVSRLNREALNNLDELELRALVLTKDELTDEEQAAIRRYVEAGGGLMHFPISQPSNIHWLPQAEGPVASETPVGIAPLASAHPALVPFADAGEADLESIQFHTFLRYSSPESGRVLQLANGAPFCLELSVGEGRVILFAAGLSETWGNWGERAPVVPLLQLLVRSVFSLEASSRTVDFGEPLAARVGVAEHIWRQPDGLETVGTIQGEGRTARSVFQPSQAGLHALVQGEKETAFAVLPDPLESRMQPKADLEKVVESLGGTMVRSAGEFDQFEVDQRSGTRLWPWIVLLIVVLLVLEFILAHRFITGGAE